MTTRKIANAEEFMERVRSKNRQRSERQRQRLLQSGKSSLTVWLPAELRTALTRAAAERGATIADTAAALLSEALQTASRENFDDAADRIGAALTDLGERVDRQHEELNPTSERIRQGIAAAIERQRSEAASARMLLPGKENRDG